MDICKLLRCALIDKSIYVRCTIAVAVDQKLCIFAVLLSEVRADVMKRFGNCCSRRKMGLESLANVTRPASKIMNLDDV